MAYKLIALFESIILKKGKQMEFIQIRKEKILVYADTDEREAVLKKLITRLIETIKAIQAELK